MTYESMSALVCATYGKWSPQLNAAFYDCLQGFEGDLYRQTLDKFAARTNTTLADVHGNTGRIQ
jgi:hypothetical protein